MESEKYCPVSQQVCKGSSCVFYNPSKADSISLDGNASDANNDYYKCRIWQNNFYTTELHRSIKCMIAEELTNSRICNNEISLIRSALNKITCKLNKKSKEPVIENKKIKTSKPKKKKILTKNGKRK